MSWFGPLVTKVLKEKAYETKNFLDQLPKEAYDEMQIKVLNYIDEYRVTFGDMPNLEIFKTDYPQYYTEVYINVPIEDLRERFKQDSIKYLVNKRINEFEIGKAKGVDQTEPIYILVNEINTVNQAGRNKVKRATDVKNVFETFGGESISLGVPFIDNVVKMYAGNYYCFYGQSGGTKSYLMSYIAAQLALAGKRVLIAPCEVGNDGYIARISGILNNFSLRNALSEIEKDKAAIDKYDRIANVSMNYLSMVRGGEIYFTDKVFPTISDIENDYKNVKPDIVIVDSVYDLAARHEKYSKNKYEAEADISRQIKEFCKSGVTIDDHVYKPRILVASQLSRNANSKTGNMSASDIFGSTQFFFDADNFFLVFRSPIEDNYCVESIKTRNSEMIKGTYTIHWDTMVFDFETYFGVNVYDGIKTLGKHTKKDITDYALRDLGITL
jgi:hypothetical protein